MASIPHSSSAADVVNQHLAANGGAISVTISQRNASRGRLSGVDEQSPLLRASSIDTEGVSALPLESPVGSESSRSIGQDEAPKSTWYLFLLTLGALGLQVAWSVETSHGSPYLLSLGLSKSLLALVWIAGPLSGTVVQPLVGLKSDRCRIRWGKRRPFIMGGTCATVVALMALAWTRELVRAMLGMFGVGWESQAVKTCTMVLAVFLIYLLDFGVNVLQAGIQAYIVDCAPTHQQEAAYAWVVRLSGVGNILGYLSGYVDLPKYLPWLGDRQFKVLCAIASVTMAVTATISCMSIHERDPRWDAAPDFKGGLASYMNSLARSVRDLPPQTRAVCLVQFFAWMGWFPFLFYITTYIGQLYVNPLFKQKPGMSDAEINEAWERATRMGTLALLIFSFTTFAASIVLPFIAPPAFEPLVQLPATPLTPTTPASMSGSSCSVAQPKSSPRLPLRAAGLLGFLPVRGLSLQRAWMYSHLMFAGCMALTFLVRNTVSATILVAFIGIPWGLTNWAPYALISAEISERDAVRRRLVRPATRRRAATRPGADDAAADAEAADQTGVVLGIHNVAVSAPQVVATLVSSAIFRALQKPRGVPGDESVAWVLRFGGLCAVVAAWLARGIGGGNTVERGRSAYEREGLAD